MSITSEKKAGGSKLRVDNPESSSQNAKLSRLLSLPASTHAIDCRDENELFVGEILSWRVQKITLHPWSLFRV